MKRAPGDDAGNDAKRPRVDSEPLPIEDPFDDTRTTKATSLYENIGKGEHEINGHISGKVYMMWPVARKTRRVNLEVEEHNGSRLTVYRFDVALSGGCYEHFDKLDFRSQDAIKISLKGVKVEKTPESSSPHSLPMALKFDEGIAIKYISRKGKPYEELVDTWKLHADNIEQGEDPEDWFISPRKDASDPCPFASFSTDHDVLPAVEHGRNENTLDTSSVSNAPTRTSTLVSASSVIAFVKHATPPPFSPDDAQKRKSSSDASRVAAAADMPPFPKKSKTDVKAVAVTHSIPRRSSTLLPETKPISPSVHNQTSTSDVVDGLQLESSVPRAKMTKKQERRLRRKARESAAAAQNTEEPSVRHASVTVFDEPQDRSTANNAGQTDQASSTISTSKPVPSVTPGLISESVSRSHSTESSRIVGGEDAVKEAQIEPYQSPCTMQTGFRTEAGDLYTPLGDLKASGKFYNVIGVVTSIRPVGNTRNGDLCRSLVLADPSNYDNCSDGILVNCFTRKYEEWLPSVERGQVLILRALKTQHHNGTVAGVGYKNKLTWAGYNPVTRKIHHGDPKDIPWSDALGDGFGAVFCPFWTPAGRERVYCKQISDWWAEIVRKKAEEMGTVHQIGDGSLVEVTRTQRVHRLICDASPALPPNGFFDCTVEVVYGHANDNGVYSLYATDYTTPRGVHAIQADWCPPELGDYILKIEMWLEASQLGPTMMVGDYYYLPNSRVKVSFGGYVEGTITHTNKVRKLDENEPGNEPHFQALLERKKEWQEKNGRSSGSSDPFKHCLLKDGIDEPFFNCTVEVLHAGHDANQLPCIYITDYSYDSSFGTVSGDHPWSRGLEGRVAKVQLWEAQAEMIKAIEPGCFYSIRKLKFKRSFDGVRVQGRLGGSERLIHKLRTQDSDSDEAKSLLQRKREWEMKPSHPSSSNVKSPTKEAPLTISVTRKKNYNTIQEILVSKKCPNKFRVAARVVEFFPFTMEECVVLRCTKCKTDIPSTRTGCLDCDDMADSHVKWFFRFFLCLEDKEGTQLTVAVHDEESSLLQGLVAADFREDADALSEFTARLKPIIGNLVEVHESFGCDEEVHPKTSMLDFVIETWEIAGEPENPRAYSLAHVTA